ncbi:hypothetical protein AB6809_28120 [Paraburkholderia sp. RCC_158]
MSEVARTLAAGICLMVTALAAGAVVRAALLLCDISGPAASTVGMLVLLAISANARAYSLLARIFGSSKV